MNSCEKSRVLSQSRGYLGELDYLEKKSRRYTQHKCNKCGLFHIWKKKQKPKNVIIKL